MKDKIRGLIAADQPVFPARIKGYRIRSAAEDGLQALELARKSKPDVAVLDVEILA